MMRHATETRSTRPIAIEQVFFGEDPVSACGVHDRHMLAANIIAAHDAAELASAAICDQLDCLPQKGSSYLMDYLAAYRQAHNAELHAKDYFRSLNTVRNSLKHQGLFPDARQWARVGETVFQNITKWCWDCLKESFSDLDEAALILDADVKRLYDDAKQRENQEDYKGTLEKLALALDTVFKNNVALRGFEAGRANSEDAIRVVGFGIHGNDFLALQQFLPYISRLGEKAGDPKWKQSEFGHPANWRRHNADFCLRTFVDVAIKLQTAPWIPGPISRDAVYVQQVEALREGVDFWREVPDESSASSPLGSLFPRMKTETRQLLRQGEKLTAMVRRNTANAETLSVSMFTTKTFESWTVPAADVRVMCVPRDSDAVREYFDWLPAIEWEGE